MQYRIAEIGHAFEPDKLMGYCVAIYFAKLLIWDKVMGSAQRIRSAASLRPRQT
jgi:hypothetical protein